MKNSRLFSCCVPAKPAQFQAVQLCEQQFFFPPKAKYEQYQDHICFYGSLGSHIHILCHYMARWREGKREFSVGRVSVELF